MNLDQQLCSLELAKRLKELGVNALSIFSYEEVPWIIKHDGEVIETKIQLAIKYFSYLGKSINSWPAYSVAWYEANP